MSLPKKENSVVPDTRIALLEQSLDHFVYLLNKIDDRLGKIDHKLDSFDMKIDHTRIDNEKNFRIILSTLIGGFIAKIFGLV